MLLRRGRTFQPLEAGVACAPQLLGSREGYAPQRVGSATSSTTSTKNDSAKIKFKMARPSVAARNLSLTEELERLEQSITLTLQG